MEIGQTHKQSLIVGLGKTGLSVADYLAARGETFTVTDSRAEPPCADEFLQKHADIDYAFGEFRDELFEQADEYIVNPGLSIKTSIIQKYPGKSRIGDIELFAREVKNHTPVVAITGSNGKTTVTTLLDQMAQQAGVMVKAGGNIGTPALELIAEAAELYILELSSFQLETTYSLQSHAAVILNISEDHLDRYDGDLEQYAQAKARVFNGCKTVIVNRDDDYVVKLAANCNVPHISYGLDEPQANHFGLRNIEGNSWLAKGEQLLMPVSGIKVAGKHNISNILAALALGDIVGLDMAAMLAAIHKFSGIKHRTQWVCEFAGLNWYNDSKGTNVGATIAALSGLSGYSVLIAGGQAKGADFFPLRDVVVEKAVHLVLIGEDAELIEKALANTVSMTHVNTMQEAVAVSLQYAAQADNVLLSPACASFDMYKHYEERGDDFISCVEQLQEQHVNSSMHKYHQQGDLS